MKAVKEISTNSPWIYYSEIDLVKEVLKMDELGVIDPIFIVQSKLHLYAVHHLTRLYFSLYGLSYAISCHFLIPH